jgi:hypothetical protein
MLVQDTLNFQFKLNPYLENVDKGINEFMVSNDLNIDWYCIFAIIVNNKHYIITSDTSKHNKSGYRLITIEPTYYENKIVSINNSILIYFNNLCINIGNLCDINAINESVKELNVDVSNVVGQDLDGEHVFCDNDYSKNINENDVKYIVGYSKCKLASLKMFKNVKVIELDNQSCNTSFNIGDFQIGLNKLVLGDNYNQPFDIGVLPIGLSELVFGKNYNQLLDIGVLPLGLKTLVFDSAYNQPFDDGVLPESLVTLKFLGNKILKKC